MTSLLIPLALLLMDDDDYVTREAATELLVSLPWEMTRDSVQWHCLHGTPEVRSRCRLVYWYFQETQPWHLEPCTRFGIPWYEGVERALDAMDPVAVASYCKLPYRAASGQTITTESELVRYWDDLFTTARNGGVEQEGGVRPFKLPEHPEVMRLKGMAVKVSDVIWDFECGTGSNYHYFVICEDGKLVGGVVW